MEYKKPPLTLERQLETLIRRGLVVRDRDAALERLKWISYYRLRGYTYPFQDNTNPDHPFKVPVDLDTILRIHEFDHQLRLIVLDALDRLEVAVRTQIVYNFSIDHGAWWYESPALFKNGYRLANDLEALDRETGRSHEIFLDHYRAKYGTPTRPPAWMALEVATFGLLSKLFENARNDLDAKKRIIGAFGLGRGGVEYFQNWLHQFSMLRNVCAHHSRLWNRVFKTTLRYAPGLAAPWVSHFPDAQRLYASLSLIGWLDHKITGNFNWSRNLKRFLTQEYPDIRHRSMGFPPDWTEQPLWKDKIK